MKQKIILNPIDLVLLKALQKDARLTVKELSHLIHKSATATYERIRKLETSGAITGYRAEIPAAVLGNHLVVFVSVRLKEHKDTILVEFQKDLSQLEVVQEWYHITGPHDFMLKVSLPSMEEYHYFLNHQLAALPNIATVQSLIVLHQGK